MNPATVTAAPTKFKSVTVLIPKLGLDPPFGITVPSSLTVIDPGTSPPPTSCQNLSPGRSMSDTI